MMKNIIKLEHVINERSYSFLCENNSPIPELKEAMFEFLKYLGNVEDQAKAQLEQQAVAKSNVENEIKAE